MKHAFMGLATLLGGFLGSSRVAYAQGSYTEDALMFSRQGPAGTARTLGIGGANVALGADFGNVTSNPAGLGFYTKSELTLTPGLGFGNADAMPTRNAASLGNQTSMTQAANSFHIANAGVVFANRHPDSDTRAWRGGSLALGFTRLADFNQGFRYRNTTNDDHSFFQYFREPGGYSNYQDNSYQEAVGRIQAQSNSGNFVNLDGLAYGNYLTDFIKVRRPGGAINDSIYRTATPLRTGNVQQDEQVISKGSMSQFDIAYGGSYRDRLYVGIGLGIVSLNRTRTTSTSESSGTGTGFGEDFNFQQYTHTTGTGINARLGLIYRPVDVVRFGASIQTPTYIRLNEDYSTTLTVAPEYLPRGLDNVLTTVPGTNIYNITTPFRANGGVAVLLGKYGFLSGDIEYVGYSQARYGSNTNDVNSDLEYANQSISTGYRNTVNLRVGAEGRFDIVRVRLGYAHYGNPYLASSPDRSQQYFTGGLGLRVRNFFVDAAGVYLTYKEQYSPYSLASGPGTVANGVVPVIDYTQKRFTASLTGGLTF